MNRPVLLAHAVPTAPEPPAGAEHILAASLFDMPDLSVPMVELGGWVLVAIAVAAGLLLARGIARRKRNRREPGEPGDGGA